MSNHAGHTTINRAHNLNLVSKQNKLNSSHESNKQRFDFFLNSNLKAKSTTSTEITTTTVTTTRAISTTIMSSSDSYIRPSFYLFPNSKKHEANENRVLDDESYVDEEIDEDYGEYIESNSISTNKGFDEFSSKPYLNSLHVAHDFRIAASSSPPTLLSSFFYFFLGLLTFFCSYIKF